MTDRRIGVIGASSLVGASLLKRLASIEHDVVAYSREKRIGEEGAKIHWQQLPLPGVSIEGLPPSIEQWICVAPIWVLPYYFTFLKACGVRKVIALSSTSRFTKNQSTDPEERRLANRIIDSEMRLKSWAEENGAEWIVLRPTLIYGYGQDKNVSEIARFIRRFGFFPLFGEARGLRQPIHAADVAEACFAVLQTTVANRAYNISGGETLTYRDMVLRIFGALGCQPRLLNVPLWIFGLGVRVLRSFPRYRNWSSAMAERMNSDLVFDRTEATRDWAFEPRRFVLSAEDLQIEVRQ